MNQKYNKTKIVKKHKFLRKGGGQKAENYHNALQ